MLLASVVAGLLSASPPLSLGIVVARRTGMSLAEGQALARDTAKALAEAGLVGAKPPDVALAELARLSVTDTATCAGRRPCLAQLGRELHVDFLLGLSVANLEGDQSVALELIRVADETLLDKDSLLLAHKARPTAALLQRVADKFRQALAPPKPEVVADAPRAEPTPAPPPKLTPATPAPAAVVVAPTPRVKPLPAALTATGVAAVIAGAVAIGAGLALHGTLGLGTAGADGRVRSGLSGAQAQALADQASVLVGAGLVGAGVGAALGVTGIALW